MVVSLKCGELRDGADPILVDGQIEVRGWFSVGFLQMFWVCCPFRDIVGKGDVGGVSDRIVVAKGGESQ